MDSIDLNAPPGVGTDYVSQATSVLGGNSTATGVIKVPETWMVFENGDSFAAFCYTYAYQTGFELFIRSSTLLKEYKDKGISRRCGGDKQTQLYMMSRIRLACKKGAVECSKNANVSGCKVFFEGRLNSKNQMSVRSCSVEHNHPTDPENVRHMVSFREIGAYFKSRMMLNDAAGISITNNFASLVLECGGEENLPFNSRDVRNCINLERRIDRLGGDADALISYFLKLKMDQPDFYFAIDKDSEGRLTRLFWADARCRGMCKAFGDAVTFDTTFLSNRYGMSFAPFIGVNHHGSTICFAAALIVNEEADSFIWIFEKWMECMGRAPTVILTDQCRSIAKAVKTVFPSTPHRLCLWHIMKNAAKNLGALKEWRKIDEALLAAVHDSLDEGEFDTAWADMLGKFELQDNSWVIDAYEIRRSWVPAYWRDTFCAGMSSTQRSEQSNRFFKSYLNVQTGLRQFITQFERALKAKVEHESKKNFACVERPSKTTFQLIVEEVFHKVYTNDKYKEVQEEVLGLVHTNVTKIASLGTVDLYIATEDVVKPVWRRGVKSYNTTIDGDKGVLTCTCKLFEFRGILCRHIIQSIKSSGVKYIPGRYILDRWRKDLVRGYEHIRVGYYDPHESSRMKKVMDVRIRNEYVESIATQDEECYNIFLRGYEQMCKEMHDYMGIEKISGPVTGPGSTTAWSRRRLQPREVNQRHRQLNTPALDGDHTIDPFDKRRKGGRPLKVRQKAQKRKRKPDDQGGPSTHPDTYYSQMTPATPVFSTPVDLTFP